MQYSQTQMTAAKVMDIISRLPGCARQAADAAPACTPGQNGRCTNVIENSQIGVSRYLDTSTKAHMGPNHCPVWKIRLFLLREKQFEKVLLEHGWGKVPIWECLFVNREKGTILISVRGRYDTGWEEADISPTWKTLMKDVNLGKPTSSSTMFIWVALKQKVK